ncbi:hypothetical protein ACSQ67_014595 [Phaseolus vulgaris]
MQGSKLLGVAFIALLILHLAFAVRVPERLLAGRGGAGGAGGAGGGGGSGRGIGYGSGYGSEINCSVITFMVVAASCMHGRYSTQVP